MPTGDPHSIPSRMATAALIAGYIIAIATANLLAYHYGPWVTPYTAFLLIGLDLTSRDRLQDLFTTARRRKMLALIATGSIVAYAANPSAGRIALASATAFAASSSIDWLIYAYLRQAGHPWLVRANTANLFGAAVDSALFPTLAFGVWLWPIVFAQFTAKVAGGMFWSLIVQEAPRALARDDGTP